MKKIRLIIGMLVFVLGISNSSLSIFAAELDNENEQKIVSEIGGNLINSEDIPEGVIPIKFSNVEQIQKYLSLATEMSSEGKFLDLSPKIFNKLYDETNNIIDFSNYNITEADFTEPTFSNENIANVAVYSNTGVKSKKLSVTAGQSMTLYAKYTYANSKFKSITSVTSSYSGLTIGNKWKQDTYSSKITNSGKNLSVTVYGHYDHYILINSSLTHISTSNAKYSASWNY